MISISLFLGKEIKGNTFILFWKESTMLKHKIKKIRGRKKVYITILAIPLEKSPSFMMSPEELPSSPIRRVPSSKYQNTFLTSAETWKNRSGISITSSKTILTLRYKSNYFRNKINSWLESCPLYQSWLNLGRNRFWLRKDIHLPKFYFL